MWNLEFGLCERFSGGKPRRKKRWLSVLLSKRKVIKAKDVCAFPMHEPCEGHAKKTVSRPAVWC